MKTKQKTQQQHFYAQTSNIGRANEFFLQLVQDGLTRQELEALMKKRPSLYSRFSGFLGTLPNS